MAAPLRQWIIPLTVLCVATPHPSGHAGWYAENVEKGADLVTMELRYPHWVQGLYFSCWNMVLQPQGGSFYGGVQSRARSYRQEDGVFDLMVLATTHGVYTTETLAHNLYQPMEGVERDTPFTALGTDTKHIDPLFLAALRVRSHLKRFESDRCASRSHAKSESASSDGQTRASLL